MVQLINVKLMETLDPQLNVCEISAAFSLLHFIPFAEQVLM